MSGVKDSMRPHNRRSGAVAQILLWSKGVAARGRDSGSWGKGKEVGSPMGASFSTEVQSEVER